MLRHTSSKMRIRSVLFGVALIAGEIIVPVATGQTQSAIGDNSAAL